MIMQMSHKVMQAFNMTVQGVVFVFFLISLRYSSGFLYVCSCVDAPVQLLSQMKPSGS